MVDVPKLPADMSVEEKQATVVDKKEEGMTPKADTTGSPPVAMAGVVVASKRSVSSHALENPTVITSPPAGGGTGKISCGGSDVTPQPPPVTAVASLAVSSLGQEQPLKASVASTPHRRRRNPNVFSLFQDGLVRQTHLYVDKPEADLDSRREEIARMLLQVASLPHVIRWLPLEYSKSIIEKWRRNNDNTMLLLVIKQLHFEQNKSSLAGFCTIDTSAKAQHTCWSLLQEKQQQAEDNDSGDIHSHLHSSTWGLVEMAVSGLEGQGIGSFLMAGAIAKAIDCGMGNLLLRAPMFRRGEGGGKGGRNVRKLSCASERSPSITTASSDGGRGRSERHARLFGLLRTFGFRYLQGISPTEDVSSMRSLAGPSSSRRKARKITPAQAENQAFSSNIAASPSTENKLREGGTGVEPKAEEPHLLSINAVEATVASSELPRKDTGPSEPKSLATLRGGMLESAEVDAEIPEDAALIEAGGYELWALRDVEATMSQNVFEGVCCDALGRWKMALLEEMNPFSVESS